MLCAPPAASGNTFLQTHNVLVQSKYYSSQMQYVCDQAKSSWTGLQACFLMLHSCLVLEPRPPFVQTSKHRGWHTLANLTAAGTHTHTFSAHKIIINWDWAFMLPSSSLCWAVNVLTTIRLQSVWIAIGVMWIFVVILFRCLEQEKRQKVKRWKFHITYYGRLLCFPLKTL